MWLVDFAGPSDGVIMEPCTWPPLAALSKASTAERPTQLLSSSPAPPWPAQRRSHRSPASSSPCPDFCPAAAYRTSRCFYLQRGEWPMSSLSTSVHATAPPVPWERRRLGLSAVQRMGVGEPSVLGQVCFQKAIPAFLSRGIWVMSPPAQWQERSCLSQLPPGSPSLCCKYLLWLVFWQLPITRNNSRMDSPTARLVCTSPLTRATG